MIHTTSEWEAHLLTHRQRYLSRFRDYYTPCITNGLTFNAPLIYDDRPLYSAAGTTAMSTKTVDADGTIPDYWQDGLLRQATVNIPRMTRNGVLSEAAATNSCLQSADNTVAANWVATNMAIDTTAHTDPANASNTTCELRATAANATLLQSITLTSAAYVYSVYLKRKTGTGTVDITIDNGTTWTAQTIVSTTWTRCYVTKTAANPVVGIRIQTSGDEVAALFHQCEAGTVPTSYIPTTTAAVTRSAEVLRFGSAGNIAAAAGTIHFVYTPVFTTSSGIMFVLDASVATDGVALYRNSSDKIVYRVYSGNVAVASITATTGTVVDVPIVVSVAWAANDFRFYINGVLQGSDTAGAAPTTQREYIAVMQGASGNYPDVGREKHLLVYNYAQTVGEIQAIVRKDMTRWMPQLSL